MNKILNTPDIFKRYQLLNLYLKDQFMKSLKEEFILPLFDETTDEQKIMENLMKFKDSLRTEIEQLGKVEKDMKTKNIYLSLIGREELDLSFIQRKVEGIQNIIENIEKLSIQDIRNKIEKRTETRHECAINEDK